MDTGEFSITEPAVQAAAFTACFTAIMFFVKSLAEWRRNWRQSRIERISKLLDEYYWPMLLCLSELHDMQCLLEDAECVDFHEKARMRKIELAEKLETIMTTGVAMAQPRSMLVAPFMAVHQQLSYLRLGADVTHTLPRVHIEVFMALCRERLKQFQREYNRLTLSPVMALRRTLPRIRSGPPEDPSMVNTIRKTAERALERRERDDFAHILGLFSFDECSGDGCTANDTMSMEARTTLSSQFRDAMRKFHL